MLGVGETFPSFSLVANVSACRECAFTTITDLDYPETWKVYFFWPRDFTAMSRMEIVDFGNLDSDFKRLNAQLLGGSIESEFAHLAWRSQDCDLRDLPVPMLADTNRSLCGQLGILDENEGVPQRATFIVDKTAIIRFVYVTDLTVTRDPSEVFRVLADLQGFPDTDGFGTP